MQQTAQPNVVGVRFSKVGKSYYFSTGDVADVKVGDMVVVETSRGWQLGRVSKLVEDAESPQDGWKAIDRRATPRDLLLRQMWQMKEADVVQSCQTRATELRLAGIKVVSAEYSFDGSRLMILFSTETEEKYDLKSLRQDMQKLYSPSQVEMRQVGPRDVAKVICGMGACGLETRCCCLFLTEFSSISIRMAKEQGISLTPTEITGMCGRLRCCLIYEYDTYVDARSKLPKRNKQVRTPQGIGKVIDLLPLRESVVVDIPEVGPKEFLASEILPADDTGTTIAEAPSNLERLSQKDSNASDGNETTFIHLPSSLTQGGQQSSATRSSATNISSSKSPRSRRSDRTGRAQKQKDSPSLENKKRQDSSNDPQNSGQRPGQRWKKKTIEPGHQPGEGPNRQKTPPEGGSAPQGGDRNNRRRKGPRRDNDDTQNRT